MHALEKGSSLIEVMIAMTILAIGILGLGYLQANAMKYFGSAAINSNAAFAANAMLADVWGGGNSNVTAYNGVDTADTGTWPTSGVAALAVSNWAQEVQSTLPHGRGMVQVLDANGGACQQPPCTATVSITWTGTSGTQSYAASEYIIQP
jgi:type IV pilus assembly protein PilV